MTAVGQGQKPVLMPGLDGIRALAVAAVIVFHADLRHFLPGGFLGVDVFFVVSGFLITSLLFAELERSGGLSFSGFYLRRSRRLLPALLTVLVACALYSLGWAPDAVEDLRRDLPPALLYYSNFWQLFDQQPYFAQFGRPHALQHLWSLAIEEQFYLLWPPLVLLLFRLRRRLSPGLVMGVLALGSMVWMGALADHYNIPYENKPERLYFGTDTHAIGLLFGAFLACHYRPLLRPAAPATSCAWGWNGLGVLALGYLLLCFVLLDEASGWLYRGGFASVALATLGLILVATRPGSWLQRGFELPPLRWLGQRSYGLYLWHWPVFVFFRPGEELPAEMVTAFLIRLGLTLLLADLTYRWIEQPIRHQGLRAFGRFNRPAFAAGALVCGVALIGLQFGELPAASPAAVAAQQWAAAGAAAVGMAGETPAAAAEAGAEQPAAADLPLNPQAHVSRSSGSEAFRLDLTDIRITALGDSVMLGARPVLNRRLPITLLDAEVGRQGSDVLKTIRRLVEAGTLADIVLIHIGSNGYIFEQNLKQILQLLRDRKQVVFINIHADRYWVEANNALLQKYQGMYDNLTLIDWNGAAEGHPEYFVKDGVHLTDKGMLAYVEMIRVALGVPEMSGWTPAPLAKATSSKKETAHPAEQSGGAAVSASPASGNLHNGNPPHGNSGEVPAGAEEKPLPPVEESPRSSG